MPLWARALRTAGLERQQQRGSEEERHRPAIVTTVDPAYFEAGRCRTLRATAADFASLDSRDRYGRWPSSTTTQVARELWPPRCSLGPRSHTPCLGEKGSSAQNCGRGTHRQLHAWGEAPQFCVVCCRISSRQNIREDDGALVRHPGRSGLQQITPVGRARDHHRRAAGGFVGHHAGRTGRAGFIEGGGCFQEANGPWYS